MPVTYNWHMTARCNYSCHYCFARWERGSEIYNFSSETDILLNELSKANQVPALHQIIGKNCAPFRINLVGGEPLLLGKNRLASIIEKAQQKYGFIASLVTNGSLLMENLELVSRLDTLGLSVDSFSSEILRSIGRCSRSGKVLSEAEIEQIVTEARKRNPNIKIKFNIVVNQYNYRERIVMKLVRFAPDKIKIFRQMPFRGGKGITDLMFEIFLVNNSDSEALIVVEDNDDMTSSYLMIDPGGRFFQNGNGSSYAYSSPIHQVGLNFALAEIDFAPEKYSKRYENQI